MIRFVLLAALLTSCTRLALPKERVQTKWLDYYFEAGERPCQEVLERADAFVDALVAYWELTLPGDFRIRYYKFPNARWQELSAYCKGAACTAYPSGKVYTVDWLHEHELTHAVLGTLGLPPSLFTENVAYMFSCGAARWIGEPIDRSAAIETRFDADYSRPAMAFVRFLGDHYGKSAFKRFYAAASEDDTPARVEEQFLAAFGETIAEAAAKWRESPPQREGEPCVFLADACETPPLSDRAVRAGDVVELEDDFACLGRARTLEVQEPVFATLSYTDAPAVWGITLTQCDAPNDAERAVGFPGAVHHPSKLDLSRDQYEGKRVELWTTLAPGRYSVRYGPGYYDQSARDEGHAALRFSFEDEGAAPSMAACDATLARPIAADLWSVVLALPGPPTVPFGRPELFLRLTFPASRRVAMYGGGSADFCAGGCASLAGKHSEAKAGPCPNVGDWADAGIEALFAVHQPKPGQFFAGILFGQ